MTLTTLRVFGPAKYLNANAPIADRHVRNRLVQEWREASCAAHRVVLVHDPWAAARRFSLLITVVRPTHAHSDADNLAPTGKACRDGAVDAGMLPDDCDCHVVATTYERITIPRSRPTLILTWTPMPEEKR